MNKQAIYTFNDGLNQDYSKAKHPPSTYYDAKNIRIVNTDSQSTLAVTNEKGNKLAVTIPSITIDSSSNLIKYNDKSLSFINSPGNEIVSLPASNDSQKILGYTITRDSIILITSDSNGFDCIWEVKDLYKGTYDLTLLYVRNLNLNINNPIQIVYNYENESLQKIYWVDGINQLRFLNIKHSIANGDRENLIDLTSNSLNAVSNYNLSQAKLNDISGGGIHTSGMIQYTYNLYRLYGSQTTIAPFSELISLDNGDRLGGGELNEIVGSSPNMVIPSLDNNYTHIKVYAIKYTSFNEIPSVSLIMDEEIDSYTNFTFTDTGNKINDVSLAELIFLGSNPIQPKHIESKDNRIFSSNLKESAYILDLDCRAYSHNSSGTTKLYTGNIRYNNGVVSGNYEEFNNTVSIANYNYSIASDAINPNYDVYKYHKDGFTLGGEGLFVSYELVQKELSELSGEIKYLRFLKDDEIYRIGIKFYNKLGQQTDVKWIADFKSPVGNLEGKYNTLKVQLNTVEIENYLTAQGVDEDDFPVGYKILRAKRDIKDMTILCQGSLTGMMVQTTEDVRTWERWAKYDERHKQSKNEVKLPIPLTRGFTLPSSEQSLYPTSHLRQMNEGRDEKFNEIYRDADRDYKRQQTWQYTKMMQMHSPEILFNNGLVFGNGLQLKVKGLLNHTGSNQRYQSIEIESQTVVENDVYYNITNLKSRRKPDSFGTFGPIYDGCEENRTDFLAYNRTYKNFTSNGSALYSIYGAPEITERGQGSKPYNGNSRYNYNNSLESIITDKYKGSSRDDEAIQGINSFGSKCATIVLGGDTTDERDRPALEDLATTQGSLKNALVLSEIVRPHSYIYTGDIYGGLSVEDKSRTQYIEIGEYKNFFEPTVEIENAGDVYVQNYVFGRILKTDTEVYNCRKLQLTETVEHPVETTVNLLNRNDSSLLGWDNKFQPRYDEFHQYNRVYSQLPTLIVNQSDNTKVKRIEEFNNRIISSKLKVPGEFIDSWTDFLENEVMDLDGKYGSINQIISFNDVLFALQDRAVAQISVNPRIQTQGSDGVSIELGTGGVLYDYNYVTTESGTLNKWSVFTSPYGMYYYDILNKSYNRFDGKVNELGPIKGLNIFFRENTNYDQLIVDNPLIKQGIVGGYDDINKDALLTFHQGDNSFTIAYNDMTGNFTSFYSYLPTMYINRGFRNIMVNPDSNKLYDSFEGEYNTFFDVKYPSYITLLLNPEANVDCVFDNIEYNSELYIDDIDQPDKTLSHIQAWNEYQNSGRIPLINGRGTNLRRLFRKWRANIPREGRQRIRNPWIYLKLELDTETNSKLILHDIIVKYTR